MPLPSTMTPIATNTLTAAAASVTFSSIPQGYTDLIVIASVKNDFTAALNRSARLRFNGDTGTNYSETVIYGTGSAAASTRETSQASAWYGEVVTSSASVNANSFSNFILNIMNYSNTTTFKTFIARSNVTENFLTAATCLYSSTNPLTSITFFPNTPGTSNFVTGSTITLYGIKAA